MQAFRLFWEARGEICTRQRIRPPGTAERLLPNSAATEPGATAPLVAVATAKLAPFTNEFAGTVGATTARIKMTAKIAAVRSLIFFDIFDLSLL